MIIKYNEDLSEDWVEVYDLNSDGQYFAGVDCDGNGNMYITGDETDSNGNDYLNVLRYNPDSSLQWKEPEADFFCEYSNC